MPSGRVWIGFGLTLDQLWLSIGCARLSGDFILNAISTITRAETRPNYQKSPRGFFSKNSPSGGFLVQQSLFQTGLSHRALAKTQHKNRALANRALAKFGFAKPVVPKLGFAKPGGTEIGFCRRLQTPKIGLPRPDKHRPPKQSKARKKKKAKQHIKQERRHKHSK